jgi:hypothetical protein
MHEPHSYPQKSYSAITSGEDQHHYRQSSSGAEAGQGPSVPFEWHGSNRTGNRKLHYAGVVQFDKEASQTRDYCVAALLSKSGATRRATRPDPLGKARGRLFAAQKALAQDDKRVFFTG